MWICPFSPCDFALLCYNVEKDEAVKPVSVSSQYTSPIGNILLTADDIGITGLWLEGGKYSPKQPNGLQIHANNCHITLAKQWLDIYFSGKEPNFSVALHPQGTDFQRKVWDILCSIPYGQTRSYGTIAGQLGKTMSAQAVGGAVGRNPISILIPCHRVIGSDRKLTGYAGGLEKKRYLLDLEQNGSSANL